MVYDMMDPMAITFGVDPVRDEVRRLIARLEAGEVLAGADERKRVDFKEEAGRRTREGEVLPGSLRNSVVAEQLAAEAACMANTPGGGALIVGVSNRGQLLGAGTDAEWLRERIFAITQRQLTVDVVEHTIAGIRLLVLVAPEAVEPIRVHGKVTWRVNTSCVEVDAATWHARRMVSMKYDWSGQDSGVPASRVRSQALDVARDFLTDSSDPAAAELAAASNYHLLRRLNVVTEDDMLTNAGVLAFVGRGDPCLDYVHRDVAGGDSTQRVRRSGRSLLEELAECFVSIDAHNAIRHVQTGLAIGQVRDIPRLAAREAVVNGVAHREWGQSDPTVVEHVGRTLRVTSPGGFFGGVNATNIITHPSHSRNRALTQLLADLKVAEREGIGVDRMVREMVRVGHRPPDIREISGPFVRASLIGDALDEGWINWLASAHPLEESRDIFSLLLLRRLLLVGWVDVPTASTIVQLTEDEAEGALLKLGKATIAGQPTLRSVAGVPDGTPTVWKLHPGALAALAAQDAAVGRDRPHPTRAEVARTYAESRGRISSTELGSIVGASASNVGSVLKSLQAEGVLDPSTPAGRGRGFFYRWAG